MSEVVQKKGRALRKIAGSHLSQARGSLLLAGLCMAGFTLTELIAPWPLKIIFDHLLLDRGLPNLLRWLTPILGLSKPAAIVAVSSSILIIALIRGLFAYSQSFITARIGHEMVYRLRIELFTHLQKLSLSFHTRARTGELLSRVVSDTTALRDVFAESALNFAAHTLTVAGMLVVMFLLDWRLALIVLGTLPVLASALFGVYRKIKDSARRQREREGAVSARIFDLLSSIQIIRTFAREGLEADRFAREGSSTLAEGIRTARMEAAATRSVELISAGGLCAVVLFGSLQVVRGRLLPGEVLVFTAYLTSLYKPLRTLARISSQYTRAIASAERIRAILDLEPENPEDESGIVVDQLRGEITFENVCFRYDPGAAGGPALRDISFHIRAGESVALVGPSGAGKSTIANLLLAFYQPDSGRILIDGQDIRRYQRRALRRRIGVVLQESILVGASVRENITYGKPEASDLEIEEAARAAAAHGFITRLPQGYETIIGERGSSLSGGQRQRICLARAIIKQPPILILDEPTSAIDAESAELIRDALDQINRHRTVIVISHHFAAIERFNRILVLRDGQLVESGTHAQLLALNGYYRHLFNLQNRPDAQR